MLDSGNDEEEKEGNEVPGAALTSTSQTLVLSENRNAGEESSPLPQQEVETSPPSSPRAPSPKRARIEAGEAHAIVAEDSSASILKDVSFLYVSIYDFILTIFLDHLPSFSSF
jgi:hypothetical protein